MTELLTIPFSGVSSLTEAVLAATAEIPTEEPLWYRGATCRLHDLSPKLCRGEERAMDAVYDREARLLARFRERSQPYWQAAPPASPWEHLFAMQHHGAPTRLLDWSENLYVAAYFSALKASAGHTCGEHDGACVPTIWMLRPVAWNAHIPQLQDTGIAVLTVADDEAKRWEPQTHTSERLAKRAKWPVAMYGVHNTARIVAQRGTFTIAGDSWQSMDTVYQAEDVFAGCLTKFELVDSDSAALMGELSRLGFAESMIFPDLVGLSRELDRSEGWVQ